MKSFRGYQSVGGELIREQLILKGADRDSASHHLREEHEWVEWPQHSHRAHSTSEKGLFTTSLSLPTPTPPCKCKSPNAPTAAEQINHRGKKVLSRLGWRTLH